MIVIKTFLTEHRWEIIFGLLFAALFGAFIPVAIKRYKKFRRWINLYGQIEDTGLKAIYPRTDSKSAELSKRILSEAAKDDELLLVGRTHYGLLKANQREIIAAIRSGAILKLLLLDSAKLKPDQHIDLRSLQLKDAYFELSEDLRRAESVLQAIRMTCQREALMGSIEVYRTDVLVQSSVVISLPHDSSAKRRVLYDFSFGHEESDKFVQSYETPKARSSGHFCERLCTFYSKMFKPDVSLYAPDLSYNKRSQRDDPAAEAERVGSRRMISLIGAHRESEAIRENGLSRLLIPAREIFKVLSKADGQTDQPAVPPPLSVQIEMTNICSTSCSHCFRFRNSHTPEMDTNIATRLIAELSELGVRTITLSGGEPTLHSQFTEILVLAKAGKLGVGILSNGVGLTDRVLHAVHENARWLRLSIDGSSAKVYGRVRKSLFVKRDAFEEVENTIKRFTRLSGGADACKLAICYTIQRANAHDVLQMIKWVRGLGLSDKCLVFKIAHGHNGFLCTEKQLRDLDDLCHMPGSLDVANLDYLAWFLRTPSNMPDVISGRPTVKFYSEQKTRCFTPYLFSLIDPKGDVYPCCFLFEDNQDYAEGVETKRRQHCIGSLREHSFRDIWQGLEYNRVRDELTVISPAGRYEACGQCTRHCNHNRWLSELYNLYTDVELGGGVADRAINQVVAGANSVQVWV